MAAKLFHRIVAPTDFSICAEEAWALAQRVASTLGSEVVLVHVFVEPSLYGDPPLTADKTWEVYREAQKWVADEIERWGAAAREKGVAVRGRWYAPARLIRRSSMWLLKSARIS